jgi:hypothetical protein
MLVSPTIEKRPDIAASAPAGHRGKGSLRLQNGQLPSERRIPVFQLDGHTARQGGRGGRFVGKRAHSGRAWYFLLVMCLLVCCSLGGEAPTKKIGCDEYWC